MKIANVDLIPADVDWSLPWTSDAFWCGHVSNFSISLVFEGAPEGILRLQASNDVGKLVGSTPFGTEIDNWTNIDGSSQLIEESGDHTWSVSEVSWRWTRVQWAPSSGTASLVAARLNTKGF